MGKLELQHKSAVNGVLPEEVSRLVDRIFDQLAASCPVILTLDAKQIKNLKGQWILGFAENGVHSVRQVQVGMRALRAKDNGFLPSVGEFIAWCKGDDYALLGLPNEDELYKRVQQFMGYGMSEADKFKFTSNAEYWLVTELYIKNRNHQWDDKQLKRAVVESLKAMAERIKHGEIIPVPKKQLPPEVKKPATEETIRNHIASWKAMFGRRVAQ